MKPIFSDELLRLLQKISEHYQPPTTKCKRGGQPHFSDFILFALSGRGGCDQNFCWCSTVSAFANRCKVARYLRLFESSTSENYSQAVEKFDFGSRTPNLHSRHGNPRRSRGGSRANRQCHWRQNVSGSRRKVAQKASVARTDSAWTKKCWCWIKLVQKWLQRFGARLPLGFAIARFSFSRAAVCHLASQ